ncbi:hypothetical protein EYV94_23345 [Puteibacter caeruleilacunae]|nr:hypothetical protein EYV94_23345 [Puteibacter caeruleilacunae]
MEDNKRIKELIGIVYRQNNVIDSLKEQIALLKELNNNYKDNVKSRDKLIDTLNEKIAVLEELVSVKKELDERGKE